MAYYNLVRPIYNPAIQKKIPQITSPVQGSGNAGDVNAASATFQNIETSSEVKSNNPEEKLGKAIADATKAKDSGSENDQEQKALSDERCKELFGSGDLVAAIAGLKEYKYRYKPGAEKIDPDATPEDLHVGPMAQELAKNPVTESTVEEDPLTGFLTVNTKQLTLAEMSVLSAMAKRILALEEKLNDI